MDDYLLLVGNETMLHPHYQLSIDNPLWLRPWSYWLYCPNGIYKSTNKYAIIEVLYVIYVCQYKVPILRWKIMIQIVRLEPEEF